MTPRRKGFFNRELETSDYETVQAYINRAKREKVKNWRNNIRIAKKVHRVLRYKDPANWTAQEIVNYLDTLSDGAQATTLDAIRQVAPHLKEQVRTGVYREKLRRRKKDVFAEETKMIIEALRAKRLYYPETIFKLHVTTGGEKGSGTLKLEFAV